MMFRLVTKRCAWCGVDNSGHAQWCIYYPNSNHAPRRGVLIFGEEQLTDENLLGRMRIQGERPVTTSGKKVFWR